jgi:RNA polymerase sigma-70 factor (ECF subfamily)
VPLTDVDNDLLRRCLKRERGAWNDFVDRFLGLVYHVIHFTSFHRSVPLQPEDVEDVAAELLLAIVADDYAVLRKFRGQSSLATYLTVITRRLCIQALQKRITQKEGSSQDITLERKKVRLPSDHIIDNKEEVVQLLKKLPSRERRVVRLRYLEGRSYEEIATKLHLPVNSIGPILNRAKKLLRGSKDDSAHHRPARKSS